MNGWSLTSVPLAAITAGGHSTQVRAGAVATVLEHVARRFHAEVEPLVTFYGWRSVATNAVVGGHPRSNHPSGTALDFNGYRHPYKAPVNFSAAQVAAIRRILAEVAPVVRWGGDFGAKLRDGMHFEIVGAAVQVATVAARLTAQPAPAPAQEDTMLVIAKLKPSFKDDRIWRGDGVTRTHIPDPVALANLQSMIRLGVLKGDPEIHYVDDVDWLGTVPPATDTAAIAAAVIKALPVYTSGDVTTLAQVTAAVKSAFGTLTLKSV